MENKYQNPGSLSSDGVVRAPALSSDNLDQPDAGALSSLSSNGAGGSVHGIGPQEPKQPNILIRIVKRADIVLAVLLVLSMIGVFVITSSNGDRKDQQQKQSFGSQYETQKIPLGDFTVTASGVDFGSETVVINGIAQLNGGVVVTPSAQPGSPKAGQIYYDQGVNQLAYYNGTDFIPVGTSVTTVQGQTGAVTFTAGAGISINGTTISSTVTGGGSGTVSSPGGTSGKLAKFTGVQAIGDSLLSESGATVTVGGDLAVTSALTLGTALSVANGGTGATSLAANGVIVGNGTGALTSVTSGAAGQCLLSTAGAPSFAACPGGGGGVSSLNGQTGVVNIANASGAAGTVTINDATTAAKGIASYNSTNFSVAGGAVNTIQNINTTATPTFAGVNTNSINPSAALTVGSTAQALTLQGNGTTVLTATSGGNTTTVGFVAPAANTTINFPALAAGTYQLCTSSGNCLGGGAGGANTALSNLTGVAINTTLLPGTAGTVNLGSGTLPFGDLFIAGTSGTPGTNNFRITGASTGGLRTITLPDATGTVCLTSGNCAGVGGTGDILQGGNSFTAAMTIGTNDAFDLNLETSGVTRLTVESDGSQVTFASNVDVVLQGATAYISNRQASVGAAEAFGAGATVDGNGTAIGNSATAGTGGAFGTPVALGYQATALSWGTAVGGQSSNTGQEATALGQSAVAAAQGVALGANASTAGDTGSIAIGFGASTTASNQLVFGSTNFGINHAIIGNGVTNASPAAFTLQGTTGSGTDIAGADVTIAGGQSTGNAFGGSINFNVSTPGISGTATNALTNVASIGGATGAALFQNAVDTTQAFRIRTSTNNNLVVVDTSNSRVGIALGGSATPSLANEGLEVKGAIRISGASMDTYTTPGSAGIGARFSVVNADMSASNQIIAVGVTAASNANSRGITVLDARASAHQPSIAVISPNENEIGGFSWDGSNTAFLVKNSAASGTIGLSVAGATQLSVGTANVTLGTDIDLLLQGATAYISNPQVQIRGEAFGLNASVTSNDATAVGAEALANNRATALGSQAAANGNDSIAIGNGATTAANDSIAIGRSTLTELGSVAIGDLAVANHHYSIAIGAEASTGTQAHSIALGAAATATTTNQLVIGANTAGGEDVSITHVVIGDGVTSATPNGFTLQGTSGSGANVAGASVTIAGGQGTGTGNGGSINLQVANPGTTGSSLNSLATVFSLSGTNGAALLQNTTNTTNAFRVLNSASGELLGADTTSSILRLLNNNNAAIVAGGWTTNSNNLPDGRWEHASVTANGYVYVIGGRDNLDVAQEEVYYAKLNADGSVGTWASTTALPLALSNLSAVTANGYVYAIGGRNASDTIQTTVRYAKLNADGTIGAWSTTTALPAERRDHTSVTANGYVYVIAGSELGGSTNTVYYARLNSDGTVGAWSTTSTLTGNRDRHSSVTANGYVYSLGGSVGGVDSNEVAYAKLNTDGTLGAWATTTVLPNTRINGTSAVLNGYVYHLGGDGSAGDYGDVFYAPLNAGGTIGSWTQTTDMNITRRGATAVTSNGYIYDIGGENGSARTEMEYASPARVTIGGSLDLVSLAGENLAEGGSGGHLTAGDTHIAGLLTVTGGASLKGGAVVGNNLTVMASSDSSAAFSVVNSSAGEVIGADTTASIIRLLGNNTAHLNGTSSGLFNTGTTLSSARGAGSNVAVNGYLYVLGGCDAGGSSTTTVQYAKTNSDGSMSSWSTTTALPTASCGNSAATYNGYIYVHGGTSTAGTAQDIYYAKPNADGTITSWSTVDNPTNLIDHVNAGMVAYGGYLYITGGEQVSGTDSHNVYYGRIGADGSVPSFTVLTNWLPAIEHVAAPAVVANGYLYVFGSSNYDKIYYGKINADGSVGTATQDADVLPAARRYTTLAVLNGYLYAIAGGTGASTTVYYSTFNSDGSIGAWGTDTTALPASRTIGMGVAPVVNGYVYYLGGGDNTFTSQNTTYYASGARIKAGGSLDLTAYSGENQAEGGSAGQLTAGNTHIAGVLTVTGNALFKDGATVNNGLTIQAQNDSNAVFTVLNGAGVPVFNIDTTNARIYVGNSTADSTGALLVLDAKNTSGDPTGVNGAMYYSSYMGSMRCYQDSMWNECSGQSKPNSRRVTYYVANGVATTFAGYGDSLTQVANGGTAASIGQYPYINHTTLSSSGDFASVAGLNIYRQSTTASAGRSQIVFQTYAVTDASTNVRLWSGMTDQTTATMAGSANPAGHYAMFRYDTSAGDTNWKCITKDNVTQTITDSGVAYSTSDLHRLEVDISKDVNAIFKVDGRAVCTNTTNLPGPGATAALMRPITVATDLTAVTNVVLRIGWIYVEQYNAE